MFIPFLFWLPAVVSATVLVGLWRFQNLSIKAALILGAWFLAALVIEWSAPALTLAWAAGVTLQVLLAVVVVTWWKFNDY